MLYKICKDKETQAGGVKLSSKPSPVGTTAAKRYFVKNKLGMNKIMVITIKIFVDVLMPLF